MTERTSRLGEENTEAAQMPESEAVSQDTPKGYGLALLDENARTFVSDLDDLRAYLGAVFDEAGGFLHIAFGHDPHLSDKGKYKHGFWEQKHFVWPRDAHDAEREMLKMAPHADVYLCPYLMAGATRRKSCSATRRLVHADVDDGRLDVEKARALGGFAVGSGSPGNGHVYLPMTTSVSHEHHRQLCRALGAYLGAADSKICDNDTLRPPGTLNHKPTVRDGQPVPVTWVVKPSGDRVDPHDLAKLLGVELTDHDAPAKPLERLQPTGSDVERYMTWTASIHGCGPPWSRSAATAADTMRVVSACRASGLNLAQARWVVGSRPDLAERLDERSDDDVARCWERVSDEGQEVDDTGAFEKDVDAEVRRLRVREAARLRLGSDKQGPAIPFDAGLLHEILARPEEEAYRIQGLLPSQSSMLVVAQRKTGKTTLMLNLARSLLTAEPFLGMFTVRPPAESGRVAILNYEVSGAQLGRWAQQVGLPSDRLLLVNLRGRRDPLAHNDDRSQLADLLRGHKVESLIVDPFGRAYTGSSQNDSGEVGRWLVDLDRFARSEVGAFDLVLTAHAGWNAERSRGSSALEDWADSIVTMTLGSDGESRYLRAVGRDVAVDEDLLRFDPETRLLSLTGIGGRKQAQQSAKADALAGPVCGYVREHPGASVGEIREAMRGLRRDKQLGVAFQDQDVRDAIEMLVAQGRLRREEGGSGRPTRHYPVDPVQPESAPTQSGQGSQ